MFETMRDTVANVDLTRGAVEIFGVASGLGARVTECAGGPAALRRDGLEAWLARHGAKTAWHDLSAPETGAHGGDAVVSAVAGLCRQLAAEVEAALVRRARVVVLGGDHSCAVGTWSGAARHLRRNGPLGLVWIDAHMDSHVPATSPSGTLHGMPLACLLGYGDERLTSIAGAARALAPGQVCLVGVRSYEWQEQELLDGLGVRVIHMDEVAERGIDAALDEAIAIARRGTAGVGLSIDLDAVDPADAPGVGSPVHGGIGADALVRALRRVGRETDFLGVEIAEYNPERDRAGATAGLTRNLLAAAHGVEGGDV